MPIAGAGAAVTERVPKKSLRTGARRVLSSAAGESSGARFES